MDEKVKEYHRRYWKKNRERILRKLKERYQNDPSYRQKIISNALKNYFKKKMQMQDNKEV